MKILCAVVVSLLCSGPARATILSLYDFSGLTTEASAPPATVAPGVTASNFTPVGFAAETQTCTGYFCAGTARVNLNDSSLNLNKFFGFSVAADPGQIMVFDLLSFDAGVYHQVGIRNGAFTTRYSTDGFATFVELGTANVNAANLSFSYDLSSAGPFNSLEFRFYPTDTLSNSLSARIFLDNVRLDGAVVPEPSSLVLIGVGLAAAVLARKRIDSI